MHVFWIGKSFCAQQQQQQQNVGYWLTFCLPTNGFDCKKLHVEMFIERLKRFHKFQCVKKSLRWLYIPLKIIFTVIVTRKIIRRFINGFPVKSSWRCDTRFKELNQQLHRNFSICYQISSVGTCEGVRLLQNSFSFFKWYGHVNDIIIIFFSLDFFFISSFILTPSADCTLNFQLVICNFFYIMHSVNPN